MDPGVSANMQPGNLAIFFGRGQSGSNPSKHRPEIAQAEINEAHGAVRQDVNGWTAGGFHQGVGLFARLPIIALNRSHVDVEHIGSDDGTADLTNGLPGVGAKRGVFRPPRSVHQAETGHGQPGLGCEQRVGKFSTHVERLPADFLAAPLIGVPERLGQVNQGVDLGGYDAGFCRKRGC